MRTHSAALFAALWCFVRGSGKWTCHWRLGSALTRQPRTRNTTTPVSINIVIAIFFLSTHTQSTATLFLSYSTATVRTTLLRRQWPAASKPLTSHSGRLCSASAGGCISGTRPECVEERRGSLLRDRRTWIGETVMVGQ